MRFLPLLLMTCSLPAVASAQSPGGTNAAPVAPPAATEPNWRAMREAVEEAVKAQLIDPASAQFDWQFGFKDGGWHPVLGKRADGWAICGYVNSRNRMGGYAGPSPFVAVVGPETGIVEMVNLPPPGMIAEAIDNSCRKSFPPPQDGMLDPPAPSTAAATVDVADEIAKLAALRDKGILTPAGFEAQKAKLLTQ